MQLFTVPAGNIAGMTFSMFVSFVLPIALSLFLWQKKQAKLFSLLTGCAAFVVFALILENILHIAVFNLAGALLTENIALYALYGGLAAAVFEETGRYLAMRFCMRRCLTRENALMYGVGHGGTEAILLLGVTSLNNLANSFMINDGSMEPVLAALDEASRQTALQNVSVLWTTPAYLFFLGGLERVLAICLQIALSVFIYRAVRAGGKAGMRFYWIALGIHFGVDFLTVILSNVSILLTEAVLLIAVVLVCRFAAKAYEDAE